MCSFVEFLCAVLKLYPTKSCATFFGPLNISCCGQVAVADQAAVQAAVQAADQAAVRLRIERNVT